MAKILEGYRDGEPGKKELTTKTICFTSMLNATGCSKSDFVSKIPKFQ